MIDILTLQLAKKYTGGTSSGGSDSQLNNLSLQLDKKDLKLLNGDTVISTLTLPFGVQYAVASYLTNCSMTSTTTRIYYGSSYLTTFIPQEGFILDSVSVTMGDVDITSDVISSDGRSIIIPNVFGDLNITATAVKNE